jgi:hypothetical protein
MKDETLRLGKGNCEQMASAYRRLQILIHSIESICECFSDPYIENVIRPKAIFGLTRLCIKSNKKSDQTAGHRKAMRVGLADSEKIFPEMEVNSRPTHNFHLNGSKAIFENDLFFKIHVLLSFAYRQSPTILSTESLNPFE